MPRPTLARLAGAIRPSRRKPDVPDTDHTLLARFVKHHDEAAFRALVNRHGRTVLAACRQVLTDPADIDDAFQAAFLVLLKKPKAVDATTPLAGWLFAVAHRLAVRCRTDNARRKAREAEAATRAATARERSSTADLSWREAAAVLHDELNRLPDKYRLPLLLCGVQGLTRDEAAEQLGTTVGAVRGQLERGRTLLERRLAKRGVVLSAGLLAVLVGSSSAAGGPPADLVHTAVSAATGNPSSAVAALARGAFPMMDALKRTAMTAVLVVGLVGAGVGFGVRPPAATADDKPADKMERPKTGAKEVTADKPMERTITGTVVGHDGKPIQADLFMQWQEVKPEPLGKTNPDGTFKLTVPTTKGGKWGGWLVAKAPGHGPDFVEHGMDYHPTTLTPTAVVNFKLPKERPVKGRLIDPQGKPVAGATVTASGLEAFDSDESADRHFRSWATDGFLNGTSPQGDRGLFFTDGHYLGKNPEGKSPYTATTDKDGNYEIAGTGAGQLVMLRIRGAGVADTELVSFNRDGFDPGPTNALMRQSEYKAFVSWAWVLYGPDPAVVLDPEKIIRGTVTGPDGRPRAGVRVTFSRTNKSDLSFGQNRAVTGKDGRYEIRGARKHKGYMVEVPADPAAGLLQCQAFADDTVGYEPITMDIQQSKGVVVTGTVTNKATGRPIHALMYAEVMANNPFVDQYPPFMHAAAMGADSFYTDKDGRFRIVTIPGQVVLSAAPQHPDRDEYKPMVPDPKFPDHFVLSEGALMYSAYGGGRGFVQGAWYTVIEAKATETELTVHAEIEPATRTTVKVIDADGKPVRAGHAAGTSHVEFSRAEEFTDALTVFNLEPKKERLLAVVQKGRKLVGTRTVTADTKDPTVTLGAGGTVTGRAVDRDGKPMAGLTVTVSYTRREVREANDVFAADITTDAAGEFRVAPVFPGQELKLDFRKGNKRVGPDYDRAAKHTVAEHGHTLKLGDVKLEPAKED